MTNSQRHVPLKISHLHFRYKTCGFHPRMWSPAFERPRVGGWPKSTTRAKKWEELVSQNSLSKPRDTPKKSKKTHGNYVWIVQDGRSPNQVFFGLLQVACCTYAIKIHRIPSNVSTFPVKFACLNPSNPLTACACGSRTTQATNESTYGSKRHPLATGSFITVIPEGFFQCPVRSSTSKRGPIDDMWIPREIYTVPR